MPSEDHVARHQRAAREASADILRVLAATGRPAPAAADLKLASNSIATFPTAWRQDSELSTGAWMVLRAYSDGLVEIEAHREAA